MSIALTELRSRRVRILSIIRKELSALFKDKISMFILFIIPVVIILVVGTGKIGMINVQATVYIIDFDDTQKSHEFIDTLKDGNLTIYSNYDFDDENRDPAVFNKTANEILLTNEIAAYIIIHEGFEEDLSTNKSTDLLEVHVDMIDFISGLMSQLFIQLGMMNYQLNNMVFERDIFFMPEFRPEMDMTNLLGMGAPMMLAIVLFGTMCLVSTQSIVGDLPLKRLLITPVYRYEVVLGKISAYSILAIFQVIISLLLIKAFKVPMFGLFIDIFLVCFLGCLAGITMGIMFSTIANSRLAAAQFFLFGFMIMMTMSMIVRYPFILPFFPLEQMQVAYTSLAYRGMSLGEIILPFTYLMMNSLIYVIITLVYLNRKKEFV